MLHYSWDMAHDRYNYFSIWAIFCPFTFKKSKFFKNEKKTHGDIIILHKCAKNHDHMLYCSWYMVHDRCNRCFSVWAIICPFTPIKTKKIKMKKKNKKNPADIIILHTCTKIYDQMMYSSWDMVRDRRMGRQTEIQTVPKTIWELVPDSNSNFQRRHSKQYLKISEHSVQTKPKSITELISNFT